jgi:DNA protecting protein DprA
MSLDLETIYAYAFTLIPKLGRIVLKDLVVKAGSWKELYAQWTKITSGTRFANLDLDKYVVDATEQLSALSIDTQILCLLGVNYPVELAHIPDAPLILFAKGNLSLIHRQGLGVVGSRKLLPETRILMQELIPGLEMAGLQLVTGSAVGVDLFTLQTATKPVAVLPTLDIAATNYRVQHTLEHILANDGLILAEFPPAIPVQKYHFLLRNRIIAGLSSGVLVAQAALKSGSLHTADFALQYSRQIFALPGKPGSPSFAGNNWLIKTQAAQLVESTADICLELGLKLVTTPIKSQTLNLEQNTLITSIYQILMQCPQSLVALCDMMHTDHLSVITAIGELLQRKLININDFGLYEVSRSGIAG